MGSRILILGSRILFSGFRILFLCSRILFLGSQILFFGSRTLFLRSRIYFEFLEKCDILSDFKHCAKGRPTVGLLTTKLMKKMSNILTESLFGQTVVARGVFRK